MLQLPLVLFETKNIPDLSTATEFTPLVFSKYLLKLFWGMGTLLQRKVPGIQLIFYNLPLISHSPAMYLRASFLEGYPFLANSSFGMIFFMKLYSYHLPLSISNLVPFSLQIGEWNLCSLLPHLALSWGHFILYHDFSVLKDTSFFACPPPE